MRANEFLVTAAKSTLCKKYSAYMTGSAVGKCEYFLHTMQLRDIEQREQGQHLTDKTRVSAHPDNIYSLSSSIG